MSEKPFGSSLKCKVFIHAPDIATGTYGEPGHLLNCEGLNIVNSQYDTRSIDDFFKIIIPDLMRVMAPFQNSPENVSRCQEFYGDESNFKFSYISSPFYGPGNKGISVVDFVKQYQIENPHAEFPEIVVNIFRWNARPWVNEDFSFIKEEFLSFFIKE